MKRYRNFSFKALSLLMLAFAIAAESPLSTSYAARPAKTAKTKKKTTTRSGNNTGQSPRTSAEARKMQEAAQRDITQTKEKIRLNDKQIKEGLADLNLISSEIKSGRAKVAALQGKLASLEGEITSLSGSIAKNEDELQRMREEYLKAIKKMRLTRKNQSTLAFIFASDDFNQAMRRWRYLKQFSKWKQRKSDEIYAKIEVLGREKEQLAQAKEAQTVSLGQLSATQRELESKHQKQAKLVEGLKQNGAALQNHLSQKQNEANQLKNAIASLIAQEQAKAEAERRAREKAEAERIAREKAEAERIAREKAEAERLAAEASAALQQSDKKKSDKKKKEDKKKKDRTSRNKDKNKKSKNDVNKPTGSSQQPTSGSGNSNKTAMPATNFTALRGSLPRPVEGSWRVTNPFGRHSMPELPEVVYDNPGIDAEVAQGASVKAVAAGKVSGVYKLDGYGTVVIVSHGEYYTVYGNLASVSVSVGSQLSAGSSIGKAAPDPDDPRRGSVHFEVWKGREKQNPESWIR